MADIYNNEVIRLWYQAAGFGSGKAVTVVMRHPNGTLDSQISLIESDITGAYYFDFDFNELGQWLGVFYEDSMLVLVS